MRIDMHCHTFYSDDGLSKPKSLVKAALKKGMSAVALTDHNTVKGWKPVEEECRKTGIPFLRGEEIKVKENGKTVGEILAYFLNSEIKPSSFNEILDEIHSQNALAFAAHPFDGFRHSFKKIDSFIDRIDGVEVFNSRALTNSPNRKAFEFALQYNKPFVAGSDAHTPWEIGNAFIESKAQNLEELRKAILKKEVEFKGKITFQLIHIFSTIAKLRLIKRL